MSLLRETRAAWRHRPVVTVQTAPSGSVVDLRVLRLHVAQPLQDDDEMLESLELAAQAWLETYLGRAVLTQTREAAYDGDLGRVVLLPEPVTSVTSVTAYDEDDAASVVATTVYQADTSSVPARLVLRDGQLWPSSLRDARSVVVRYVCGWARADVPYALRQALQLLVAHWYEHRQPVTAWSVAEVPMGIEALASPYRVRTGVA